ncbi:MAG: potassium channel family protein [Paludibacter sp.]
MKSGIKTSIYKKLLLPMLVLVAILIGGYFGYIYIEDYTPLESIYMLIITFATIGYGEVHTLSDEGRVFTMLLIITGFTIGLYVVGKFSEFVIDGELSKLIKYKKMNKSLKELHNHYIVCGYGKTGRKVVEDLLAKNKKVVLVESNMERNEKIKDLYNENLIHIVGDATSDDVLLSAGVLRASNLIAVLTTDAENLFVTLSAKDFNKNIKVITRVEETNSTAKFKKAGADHIISPIEIASERIVSIATSGSDFFSFMEFAESKEQLHEYTFGMVQIEHGSDLIGKTYREANIPQRTHLVVIGYYSLQDELQVNPKAENKIELGDKLLVFGLEHQINELKVIAKN